MRYPQVFILVLGLDPHNQGALLRVHPQSEGPRRRRLLPRTSILSSATGAAGYVRFVCCVAVGLGRAWRWGCARPFPAWGKSWDRSAPPWAIKTNGGPGRLWHLRRRRWLAIWRLVPCGGGRFNGEDSSRGQSTNFVSTSRPLPESTWAAARAGSATAPAPTPTARFRSRRGRSSGTASR